MSTDEPVGPSDGTTVPDDAPAEENGHRRDGGPRGGEPAASGAPGARIRWLSWAGTALYVVLATVATVWPGTLPAALMAVSVGLFLAGFVAFAAAYVIALGRSRSEAIGMGGLYFLSGTAPRTVQRSLVGSFAVETVTAVVTASIGLAVIPADADNVLAFGILTPLYGLGLAGLWGARHGTFPPRAGPSGRGPARAAVPGAAPAGATPADGSAPTSRARADAVAPRARRASAATTDAPDADGDLRPGPADGDGTP
jgi:hypothetical protein